MNKRRAKAGERRPRPESHPALYRARPLPAITLADVKGYLAFRHTLREKSGRDTFAEAKDVMVREQREREVERREAQVQAQIVANREKAEALAAAREARGEGGA